MPISVFIKHVFAKRHLISTSMYVLIVTPKEKLSPEMVVYTQRT